MRGVPRQQLVPPGNPVACRHRDLSPASRSAATRARWPLAAEFCAAIADDELRVIEITPNDYRRMAELLTTYSSLRLQAVDACVIALAERLDLHEVAALDRRDFQVVAPRHLPKGQRLKLLPEG